MKKTNLLKVGLGQIAPVWLNRKKTLEKVLDYTQKAGNQKCDIVVFGEALIPGYPFWIERTNGAQFDSKVQKDLHSLYMDQAIKFESGDLDLLSKVCKEKKIAVVIGIIEAAKDRGGHSLYASCVYIDKKGDIKSVHRKLMPTYEERLSWSPGDGHGLMVHELGAFKVGALNCWENWMPLVRSALYAQGEDLHIAIWPGSIANTSDITRFIARESRSYVVSVSGLMHRENITKDIPHSNLIIENSNSILANGGSCVAKPNGEWLLEPQAEKEELFVIEINHEMVRQERHNFDPSGHYSRPDVTQLTINRKRQSILNIID